MTSNFWTTQNIAILSAAMMAVPTGAGAGLYLLKKSKTVEAPEPVASAEPAPAVDTVPTPAPLPQPAIPAPPIPSPVSSEPTAVTPSTGVPLTEKDRFLSRIDGATPQGVLFPQRTAIRSALQDADVVERIHTVNFESGSLSLADRDKAYLTSALRNNTSLQRYGSNTNAMIVVLGFASRDGNSRNNEYALSRAESVQDVILQNGFSGVNVPVKAWCVGETDMLSREVSSSDSYHNRAAEIWFIADRDDFFHRIGPDNFRGIDAGSSPVTTDCAPAKKTHSVKTYTVHKKTSSCGSKSSSKKRHSEALRRHLIRKLTH